MFEGKEVRVILSQAGAGKTHRLMEIVADELQVRRPEEIAFVTFTKKGAEEGLKRTCAMYTYEPKDLPYFRTLHSLTYHALGLQRNQMFGRLHERTFNKEYGYNLNRCTANVSASHLTKDSEYLNYYDLQRSNALRSKDIAEADLNMEYYHRLVHAYERFKSQQCLVDFFDCLIKYVQEGESLPVRVALIDEAQDITSLQWKVIEKAFANAEKLYIAGDENQSIYTYSGARPDYLIHFAESFPVEHLASSYRIPRKVYELSKGIVDFISDKTDKPFTFHEGNDEGEIIHLNTVDRLKNFVSCPEEEKQTASWYLLARNKCFLGKMKEVLERSLVPYWTSEGFFMTTGIINLITDYEGFRLEGYKSEEKKLKFMEKYGITDFSVPFSETALFADGKGLVYQAYIEKYGLKKLKEMSKWGNPQVLLSTIHYVKGGEAENVAIMMDNTRRTSINIYDNIDEELRVLYVGVTRAKEKLLLIDSGSKEGYDSVINLVKEENRLTF